MERLYGICLTQIWVKLNLEKFDIRHDLREATDKHSVILPMIKLEAVIRKMKWVVNLNAVSLVFSSTSRALKND